MPASAIILADSINVYGNRLTTYQLRYQRFIHGELMTHKKLSRNASSSRAIPVERMIEDIRRDPAMPVYWGANQKGMQAAEELDEEARLRCKDRWMTARDDAIYHASRMMDLGLHKQIANRILEPWMHINTVVTATDYAQLFDLRRHKDAQPEFKALADLMWEAREASTPILMTPGMWHLPYVSSEDFEEASLSVWGDKGEDMTEEVINLMKKVSVARCARVSYLTHDGRKTTVEEDIKLYESLVGSVPLHASPAEHQATPDTVSHYQKILLVDAHEGGDKEELISSDEDWDHPELHGNLSGWIQFRKTLPGEFLPG